MKDFSRPTGRKPIVFTADGDVFEAVAELSAEQTMHAVELMNTMGVTALEAANFKGFDTSDINEATLARVKEVATVASEQTTMIMQQLDDLLLPESAERFAARLRDKVNPITLPQAVEIWKWLIEQYSDRPTSPSSSSLNGHDGTGMNSTDILPLGVSIP